MSLVTLGFMTYVRAPFTARQQLADLRSTRLHYLGVAVSALGECSQRSHFQIFNSRMESAGVKTFRQLFPIRSAPIPDADLWLESRILIGLRADSLTRD